MARFVLDKPVCAPRPQLRCLVALGVAWSAFVRQCQLGRCQWRCGFLERVWRSHVGTKEIKPESTEMHTDKKKKKNITCIRTTTTWVAKVMSREGSLRIP